MPLTTPVPRREIHKRTIDIRAFARDDGLYDIEARLVDEKPFAFERHSPRRIVPPREPLHDLTVRITVDGNRAVRHVEAASHVTPWRICKEAETTLSVLVGDRVAHGWGRTVNAKLAGAASCTHLRELLIPMATVALQGINGVDPDRIEKLVSDRASSKVDSCYAYDGSRELVKIIWPDRYKRNES